MKAKAADKGKKTRTTVQLRDISTKKNPKGGLKAGASEVLMIKPTPPPTPTIVGP